MLDGDPAPSKMGTAPPLFGPCLLWPNGRPSQLLLSTCVTQITGGPICIPYILGGEDLQIVERLFADFLTFKPYNFGIAQDIASLKRRPETHTLRNICARYSGPRRSGCWDWDRCTFATSWKSQNLLPKSLHFAHSLPPLHRNFIKFSCNMLHHMRHTEFH